MSNINEDFVEPIERILDYLHQPIIDCSDCQTVIDRLLGYRTQLAEADFASLSKLSRRRILSSNTLVRHEQARLNWERANAYVWQCISDETPLDVGQAKSLNSLILGEPQSCFRSSAVFGCGETYLPESFVEQEMQFLFEKFGVGSLLSELHRAFDLYLGIVTIHPFLGGNGRTARLLGDWLLMQNGWLPMCYRSPIASHVAMTLEGASRNKNEAFIAFLEALEASYVIVLGRK